jgi:rubrerythrin
MNKQELTPEFKRFILEAQKTEITEATVYKKIAKQTKNLHNREILLQIAEDELRHYQVRKTYSGKNIQPDKRMVLRYTRITRLFGLTFGLKLMEGGENSAIFKYQNISEVLPEAVQIQNDEEQHEFQLLNMIDEKSLKYLGSVVLGLNDALVELTGVLAGLTFGFQDTKLVAFSGLITGIAAAMSMAGSEYLSTKMDNDEKIQP